MKSKILFFISFIALAAFASAGAIQQSPEQLYQSGIYKEEVEGKLEEAIAIYQEIIKKYPQNVPVAAKALLHLGLCYEKLGNREAQKAYQRLIEEYPGQKQEVALARERLARLSGPSEKALSQPTLRKIDFAEVGNSHQARLSADGKKLLYIHKQEKEPPYSIAVMDLSSGKSHILFEGIDFGANNIFEWSPDGKKVVFKHGRGELRLIDAEGGKSDVFWSTPDPETAVYPLDWSLDNRTILVSLNNDSKKTVSLAMIPVTGGEPHLIVSGGSNELAGMAHFSPDAQYIAGIKRKEKNWDIYVWSVDGKKEIQVTDHPAEDDYPFWSPDGRFIVFTSDRTNTVDLWAVPMDGPKPSGDPVCIRRNLGKNTVPTDFTPGGHLTMFVYSSGERPSDKFFLPVNPKTGEALGEFCPYAKYPAQSFLLRWSPDGTRCAYTSRKGNIQVPNIYVSSGSEKEDLEIPARNHFIGNVEWSRDGKYLIFPGFNRDDSRVGIYRVALDNFAIEPIYLGDVYGKNFEGAFINLHWLPLAGKYMFERMLNASEREIFTMDQDGKNVQLIAEKVSAIVYTWPSPDGRYLVCRTETDLNLFSLKDGASINLGKIPSRQQFYAFAWSPDSQRVVWSEGRQLKLFSVAEGTSRTLAEAGENQNIGGISWWTNESWSPDGTKIAYIVKEVSPKPESLSELWIVEATGESPRKIAVAPSSHPLLDDVGWHPSGKMIFATGNAGTRLVGFEHWIMENFLPQREK